MTSFHHEFNPIKAGSSRIIIRCKILEAGNDAITDGEEQTAALNRLEDPYREVGAFANQHPEARLLQSL